MLCTKDFFDRCEGCEKRYVIIADDAGTGDEMYFCYETEESARAAKDLCERENIIEGFFAKPKSSILLLPKGA